MRLRILIQAMHIKNWIKTGLIFIPIIFAGVLFDGNNLVVAWEGA